MSRIPFDTIWLELANAERMYVFVRERERERMGDGREIGEDDREIRAWIESYGLYRLRSIKGSQVYAFVGTHA